MTFRFSPKGIVKQLHEISEHVEYIGAERDRYRAALMEIYAYRKYHTGQDAGAAWHALLVEIPDIIENAVPDVPRDPDDSFDLDAFHPCATPQCGERSYFASYGLNLCKWHFERIAEYGR